MSYFEPIYSRLDAFTALRDQLPDLGTTDGLIRAAVAVSMHELDEADWVSVETTLDDLAQQVRARMMSTNPRAILAHAHQVLFEEARFRGNQGDYHSPANSYLPRVLQTRLGMPITLVLIYKAVLDRLGVRAVGINAPGHFMAAVKGRVVGNVSDPSAWAFIDPFAGGVLLSRDEALDRVIQASGDNLLIDEDTNLLPVATHKQWLTRLIRNLYAGFYRRGQHEDANAMSELMRLVEAEG